AEASITATQDSVGSAETKTEPLDATPAVRAWEAVNRSATICGTVVEVVYVPSARGRPTHLNFARRHPNQPFSAVIWGRNRDNFDGLNDFEGLYLCVSGAVTEYRGVPQMELRSQNNITFA